MLQRKGLQQQGMSAGFRAPQGQAVPAPVQDRPSVGSLFIPTRVVPTHPSSPGRAQPAADSTVCKVAGIHLPSIPGLWDQMPQQQQQRKPPAPVAVAPPVSGTKPPLRLSWAGSGIYFWWQLGAVHYLLSQYDLAAVPARGASGGGLAAVLSTCGVDPLEVMESAYQMSLDHDVWNRPLELTGTWGGLIEHWLDGLLPADAAQRCSGRVGLVVTQLPSCQQVLIDQFSSKSDLINVAMASAHVPLLLDGRLTRTCRGAPCVDGSFPDFFTGVNADLLTYAGQSVTFDYFDDASIVRTGRMDMLQVKQYRELKRITLQGYRYAQRLVNEGKFDNFDCSAALRTPSSSSMAGASSGNNIVPAAGIILSSTSSSSSNLVRC